MPTRKRKMASHAPGRRMRLTRTLRPFPPRHPLEIRPLARMRGDGRLELLQAAFPPLGPVRLALWRPGEEPAFLVVEGRVEKGWQWVGPVSEAYVVCWVPAEDP